MARKLKETVSAEQQRISGEILRVIFLAGVTIFVLTTAILIISNVRNSEYANEKCQMMDDINGRMYATCEDPSYSGPTVLIVNDEFRWDCTDACRRKE